MSTTPLSPKVTAGASTAAIVGLLLSYVQASTPESFAFLGKYQGVAFLIVTLAGGAFAAWWKTDPLRAVTSAVAPAPAAPVILSPAPPAEVTPIYESTPPVDPAAPVLTPIPPVGK